MTQLMETEGCVIPAKHKLPPRNNNNTYANHIKKVTTGIGMDKARKRPVVNPYTKQNNTKKLATMVDTYEHPIHETLTCAVGFDPGPGSIPSEEWEQKKKAAKTNSDQNLQSPEQDSPNSSPPPEFLLGQQSYSQIESSQATNATVTPDTRTTKLFNNNNNMMAPCDGNQFEEASTARKKPPGVYPSSIVKAFNHAVIEAATSSHRINRITEFTEYEDGNKTITTTYLYTPFSKEELEDVLNINISSDSNSHLQQSPAIKQKLYVQRTEWKNESTINRSMD